MKAFCVVLFATAVFFAGANARPRSGPTHLEKRKREVSSLGSEFRRPRYVSLSENDVPYEYLHGRQSHLPVVPRVSDFEDTEQREPGWDFEADAEYIRKQPYQYQDRDQQDEYEDQDVLLDQDQDQDQDEDDDDDDQSIDDEDYYSDEDDSHMDEESDQDLSEDYDQDQDQDQGHQDVDSGSFSAENKGMDSQDQSDGAGVINPRINFPSYPDRMDSDNSFVRSFSPRGQRRDNIRENYQRTSDLCIAVCSAMERDVRMNSAQDRAWCGCPVYEVLYKK